MTHRDSEHCGFFDDIDDAEAVALPASADPAALDEKRQIARALSYMAERISKSVSDVKRGGRFLNDPSDRHPGLPAGFTYLFQLAAHDVVQSSRTALAFDDRAVKVKNLRREPLALETVFGGGPLGCPHAYDRADGDGIHPLRCGYFSDVRHGSRRRTPPAGDLPRARFNHKGFEQADALYTEVLVADVRNDDNNILAQLTALFHNVYNALVAQTAQVQGLQVQHRTRVAQRAAVRLYRRILKRDLLTRLMQADVLARYDRDTPEELLGLGEEAREVHFSFAAARAAHAMVRESYTLHGRFNVNLDAIIRTSSLHFPVNVPTRKDWEIDWTLFFPAAGEDHAGINWAVRLGPHIANDMRKSNAAAPVNASLPAGTPIRDFLAGFRQDFTPVATLLERLGTPDAKAETQRIFDEGLAAMGVDGLEPIGADGKAVNLGVLRDDPPLPLFMLLEAWVRGDQGRSFGPLGSAIIGDCFVPVMRDAGITDTDSEFAEQLEQITFPGAPTDTMAELLVRMQTATNLNRNLS